MKKKTKKNRNPIAKELRSGAYRHMIQEERKKDFKVTKKDLEEILEELKMENDDVNTFLTNTTINDDIQQ